MRKIRRDLISSQFSHGLRIDEREGNLATMYKRTFIWPRWFALAILISVTTGSAASAQTRQSDSLLNGALIGAGAGVAAELFVCRTMEPWDVCRNDVGTILKFGAIGAGIGMGIDTLIRKRVYHCRATASSAATTDDRSPANKRNTASSSDCEGTIGGAGTRCGAAGRARDQRTARAVAGWLADAEDRRNEGTSIGTRCRYSAYSGWALIRSRSSSWIATRM